MNSSMFFSVVRSLDEPGHLLRGLRPVQRCVGHVVPGAMEAARGGAGLQVGHSGHARRVLRGATPTVQGEHRVWVFSLKWCCRVKHGL